MLALVAVKPERGVKRPGVAYRTMDCALLAPMKEARDSFNPDCIGFSQRQQSSLTLQ